MCGSSNNNSVHMQYSIMYSMQETASIQRLSELTEEVRWLSHKFEFCEFVFTRIFTVYIYET